MKKYVVRGFAIMAAVMMLSMTVLELSAQARVGGSRSMGSRGTRSYSRPASPYTQPRQQQREQVAPTPGPFQQPQSGGFMRSMAGGLLGGFLGGMLFRSLGFAGGGMGGGGFGMFEILLLAGIGYLIYRFVKKKSIGNAPASGSQGSVYRPEPAPPLFTGTQASAPALEDTDAGLSHIRQMDSSFDEQRVADTVMDLFFKVQGAWTNRDLSPITGLLTDEMQRIIQEDLDQLLRDKRINRLENIAVRKVEIAEAWQESGQDYITALVHANLLDYTTDEATGAVVAGSKTEPIKFEEYWTITRSVGNNPWRLSAIHQK